MVSVPATYGALLLGGLFATLLSGLVSLQVVIYFKMYEGDRTGIKALVLVIWALDALHTTLVWSGLWHNLIKNFGQAQLINSIYWTISATVTVTGILTFLVHCFFSHRIFMLSRHNWVLVAPILFLAVCRLISASATTAEMILNNTFTGFKSRFTWLFTLGLVLSTAVDILVTGSLFFLLKTNRTSDFNLNAVIDALILYAFETGALTTAGTIISMVFWIAMNDNLIFMGLHFVIAKLYANSLLVTLNTRGGLRRARSTTGPGSREHQVGIQFTEGRRKSLTRGQSSSKDSSSNVTFPPIRSPKVTINIERSVHCEEDKF